MSWLDKVKVDSWGAGEETMKESAFIHNPSRNVRFWMPQGDSRKIVFLDLDVSIALWEHAMKIGKDYRNFATCLSHLGKPCPLCSLEGKVSKYKVVPFTVIDRSEYELKSGPKKGTRVKDTKRLFMAKSDIFERLARKMKRLKEEGKGLQMAEFEIFRSNKDKSPSTGDDLEYIKHVDAGEFEDIKPFDYEELLAPNIELVLAYIDKMRGIASLGGEAASGGSVDY